MLVTTRNFLFGSQSRHFSRKTRRSFKKPTTTAKKPRQESESDSDCVLPRPRPSQPETREKVTALFLPHYRNLYLVQQVNAFASTLDRWKQDHPAEHAPIVIAHQREVKGADPIWLVYTSSSQVVTKFLDGPWDVGNICQAPTLSEDPFVNDYLGETHLISTTTFL
ncbi:hypothetical protein P9112_009909 [Eukaryota sp. TZLM1-RC]